MFEKLFVKTSDLVFQRSRRTRSSVKDSSSTVARRASAGRRSVGSPESW